MNDERLTLTSDERVSHLEHRAFQRATGDFTPRSRAQLGIALEPEMTVEKISGLLSDYTLLWKDFGARTEDLLLRRGGRVVCAEVRTGFVHLDVLSDEFDAAAAVADLQSRFLERRTSREWRLDS